MLSRSQTNQSRGYLPQTSLFWSSSSSHHYWVTAAVATRIAQVPGDPRAVGNHRVTFPPLPGCAKPARTCFALPLVARHKILGPRYPQLLRRLWDSQTPLGGLQLGSQRDRRAAIVPALSPRWPWRHQEKLSPWHHHWKRNAASAAGARQRGQGRVRKRKEPRDMWACGVSSAGSPVEPGRSRHALGGAGSLHPRCLLHSTSSTCPRAPLWAPGFGHPLPCTDSLCGQERLRSQAQSLGPHGRPGLGEQHPGLQAAEVPRWARWALAGQRAPQGGQGRGSMAGWAKQAGGQAGPEEEGRAG